jgi:hypothetical protein
MSYKKKKSCSNFEHHEGMPQSLGEDSNEKVPNENGDIVLTNVVSCHGNPNVISRHACILYRHLKNNHKINLCNKF